MTWFQAFMRYVFLRGDLDLFAKIMSLLGTTIVLDDALDWVAFLNILTAGDNLLWIPFGIFSFIRITKIKNDYNRKLVKQSHRT